MENRTNCVNKKEGIYVGYFLIKNKNKERYIKCTGSEVSQSNHIAINKNAIVYFLELFYTTTRDEHGAIQSVRDHQQETVFIYQNTASNFTTTLEVTCLWILLAKSKEEL